ncbi:MAG: hypothetical protein ABI769_06265 [Pseudomonadota bacterium]
MHLKPKRSATEFAALCRLLDEALEHEGDARAQWLAKLSRADAEYRPALEQMLAFDDEARRRLAVLEARLRSSTRAVRRLRFLAGAAPAAER